jgi:hypothetical protein
VKEGEKNEKERKEVTESRRKLKSVRMLSVFFQADEQ